MNWRKSSYSGGWECVEVSGGVQVRDTKDRDGTVLKFPVAAWSAFTAKLKETAA